MRNNMLQEDWIANIASKQESLRNEEADFIERQATDLMNKAFKFL